MDDNEIFGFDDHENPVTRKLKAWLNGLKAYLKQNQLVAGCAIAVLLLAIFGTIFGIIATRSGNVSQQNSASSNFTADNISADSSSVSPSDTDLPSPTDTASPSATPNTTADQSHSTFSVTPSSVNADGVSQASITITIGNSNGQIISGLAVSLTTPDQRAVINPLSTGSNVTDLSGHATFTISSTNAGTDNISVVTTTPSGVSTTLANFGSVVFNGTTTPTPSPTP